MIILSISTSSDVCSVALSEDENCIKELNISNTKTHSENLMPLIDNLLTSKNITVRDINLLACDNGPGSFTGLRIGIATVKALAEPHNIPIVCTSSLEGLAYNIINPKNNICSLIDARNNQVYCGIFDKNYNLLADYLADDINNIKCVLEEYTPLTFVGNGAIVNQKLLNINTIPADNEIHSRNIGLCSYKKFINGFSESSDSILPMYLRKSQAERMKLSNDKSTNM